MHKPRNMESNEISAPTFERPSKLEDLKSQFLLKAVKEKNLSKLLNASKICSLKPGDPLYPSRDHDYLYLIIEGFLHISLPSKLTNTGENFFAWREPQQVIGEMKLGQEPEEAEIIACNECLLVEIRASILSEIAEKDCSIYKNLCILLMKKTYQERRRSEVIQMYPAERKVAQTILNLINDRCTEEEIKAAEKNNEILIPGNLKQSEIAGYCGVALNSVNPQCSNLKKIGIIDYENSGSDTKDGVLYKVKKFKELKNVAEGKLIIRKPKKTAVKKGLKGYK